MARSSLLAHALPSAILDTFPSWPDLALPGLPSDRSRWHLTPEHLVSASRPQTLAIRHLWPTVERRLRDLGRDWFVGTDQSMLLDPEDHRVGVRPDLYVLPGQPREPIDESWPAYLPGVPAPILAFEMVSRSNWGKDYHEAPQRYATLGTTELVLFDAGALTGRSPAPNPAPLQVYRRGEDGAMKRVYVGPGPAFSEVLQLWLVANGELLELSQDEAGRERVMTPEEGEAWWREQAERQQAERRRLEKAQEQAEQERELAQAERGQAEERAAKEEAGRKQAEQAREQAEVRAIQEAAARHAAEERTAEEAAARHAAEERAAEEAAARHAAEHRAFQEAAARQAAEQAHREASALLEAAEAEARAAILDLCDLLDIKTSQDQRAHLEALSLPALRDLRACIKNTRAWPG
jgi:Uma2 family endonuclease